MCSESALHSKRKKNPLFYSNRKATVLRFVLVFFLLSLKSPFSEYHGVVVLHKLRCSLSLYWVILPFYLDLHRVGYMCSYKLKQNKT